MKFFAILVLLLLIQQTSAGAGLRNLQDEPAITALTIVPPGEISCFNILCAPDTPFCIETDEGPRCVRESCKNKVCTDTQVCIEQDVVCVTSPCPSPLPTCIENPCAVVRCGTPTPKCIVTNDGLAQCVADDPPTCKDKLCGRGEVCVELEVQCVQAPCPPIPTCVKDPCATTDCKEGLCKVDTEGNAVCEPTDPPKITCANVRCGTPTPKCIETPTGPQCVANDCKSTECKEGEICVDLEVQCVQAPCPPIPTCMEDPCASQICKADSVCQVDKDGKAICVPITPPTISCANVLCTVGTTCVETKNGPQCVPNEPLTCANTLCPPDKPGCFDSIATGPECHATCQVTRCKDGQVCIDKKSLCRKLGGCPPEPTCIANPCLTAKCSLGYMCEVDNEGNANCVPTDPLTCANALCPPDKPTCIETATGPECISRDTCDTTLCKDGQVCVEEQVICKQGPCPPIPRCIVDPCTRTECKPGLTCELDEKGNAICLPNPLTACANALCPPDKPGCFESITGPECHKTCQVTRCKDGQVCFMKKSLCKKLGGCPPQPTCIANPCLTAKCSLGFTCEAGNDGNANCVPDPDVCKGIICPDRGQKCEVTPKPCRALVCPNEAKCVPTIKQIDVCATVRCRNGQVCKNGKCIDAIWSFSDLKRRFVGTKLKRCSKRGGVAPKDGSSCSKKTKTCFFGNQECLAVAWHPESRCWCDGKKGKRKWSCKDISCPASATDSVE